MGWLKKPPTDAYEADRLLAKRCQEGDREAKGELFRRYAAALFPLLRRLSQSDADAEDLVQEVFLEALRGLHRYRGDAALSTWLHTIAIRTAYRHMERRARHVPSESLPESAGPDPTKRLESRALLRHLDILVGRLSANRRMAFLLYEIEGYSLAEIAALLGISLTAAKKRVFQAHEALAQMIEANPTLREAFDREEPIDE